jgi:hypothetical protein
MKAFEGTDLPDDLLARVKEYLDARRREGVDAPVDAALAILGRPSTHLERMTLVDALHAGRVSQFMRGVYGDAPHVMGSK